MISNNGFFPQVPLFEEAVSKYCSSDFGIAVNSATSALHIACLALGLKKEIGYGLVLILLLHHPILVYIVEQKLIL